MAQMRLYGVDDQVWLQAATKSSSLKAAVSHINVATYPAWHHMAKKHRVDLVDQMKALLGTDLPVIRCRTGCGRPARSQRRASAVGLCVNCYARQRNGGVIGLEGDRPVAAGRECDIEDCRDEQYAKGMCNLHWQRVRLWGHPGGAVRMRRHWAGDGFSADDMRACKEFVYGKRADRPLTDEGIRLRIDYEAIIKNDPCVYCGGPAGEVEHIVPHGRGGSAEWDNLAGACRSCNASKHATPLLMYLLAKNGR